MDQKSEMQVIFESLPNELANSIIEFMDEKSLEKFLQVSKTAYFFGRNMLQGRRLTNLGFFNPDQNNKWILFKESIEFQNGAISQIIQVLHYILCKKTKYEEGFKTLKSYSNHPFIHERLPCFILREHWQYQEQTVLLEALELAKIGADKYSNLECCSLLASVYVNGLILKGKSVTTLIAENEAEAKKYIKKMIDLSLGVGQGEEYALMFGEKLLALTGKGAHQIIKFFTRDELFEVNTGALKILAFCANPKSLIKFLCSSIKDRSELIPLLNQKSRMYWCHHLFVFATLLLEDTDYKLALDLQNPEVFKIAKKNDAVFRCSCRYGLDWNIYFYQRSLNQHFTLGLDISEYDEFFRLYFSEEELEEMRVRSSMSYSWVGCKLGNFFDFDSFGRAIIPPALAKALINATKELVSFKGRQGLLINFSEKYLELRNSIKTIDVDEIEAKVKILPILSDLELVSEEKAALYNQIFYHLIELRQLSLNAAIDEVPDEAPFSQMGFSQT